MEVATEPRFIVTYFMGCLLSTADTVEPRASIETKPPVLAASTGTLTNAAKIAPSNQPVFAIATTGDTSSPLAPVPCTGTLSNATRDRQSKSPMSTTSGGALSSSASSLVATGDSFRLFGGTAGALTCCKNRRCLSHKLVSGNLLNGVLQHRFEGLWSRRSPGKNGGSLIVPLFNGDRGYL